MGKRAHSRFTKGQKFVIWLVILLCAWQFLPLDTVIEAFLLFLFGGEVPGTHVVLGPNTVMMIVGGVLLAGALFFLIKGLVHLFHDPGRHIESGIHGQTTARPVIAVAQVEATPQSPAHQAQYAIPQFALQAIMSNLTTVAQARPEVAELERQEQKLQKFWAAMQPVVAEGIKQGKTQSRSAWQKIRITAKNLAHITWVCCVIAFIVGRRAAHIAAKWIAKQSIVFWRWGSPYLWKFDTWLGEQYRKARKKFFKIYREIRRSIEKR